MLRGKQRFTDAIAAYDRAIELHQDTKRRPTGWSITTGASATSGRISGRRPRPISVTRWRCRPTSRTC